MMPYSKEVMKHFRHPKNMGEIKNADGIGKVGNPVCGDVMWCYIKVKDGKIKDIKVKTFGCLPPKETIVMSAGGWKAISSTKINDKVINALGEETSISKIFKISYSGPMLKITPFVSPFNALSVTPEHPLLCVKRKWFKTRSQEPNSNWPRITDHAFLSKTPKFVEAKNLEAGDYLVFSYNRTVKRNRFFSKEWLRLIGYYLSEGYVTANNGVVNFSFNKNESGLIKEVKYLIRRLTGKRGSHRIRKNVIEIYVCSRKLARLTSSFAGKFANEKKLSNEVMLLPPKKQLEIIKTFHAGDGDITIRRTKNSPTYRLATASENLAIQLQELLARNGTFSSIVRRPRPKKHFIDGREIKGKVLYIVSFKKTRNHDFVHVRKNAFLVPIKKVEKSAYAGIVYNLHVNKKPNAYLVKGFAVHNCVAAIVTSSMITELAKGKTPEQAKKISRNNVAKALKGLPPIKMHCSNLAADALHKAIEDYEKKSKRNRRP